MSLSTPNTKSTRRQYRKTPKNTRHRSATLPYTLLSLLLSSNTTSAAEVVTAPFTDSLTGITFQRFFGARTQFAFGIALPENPSTDFIGQISAPMPNGAGWAGISLTEDMEGPLLLTAWPNGNSVVSSFRVAKNEDDSPPVVTGQFSVVEIPSGTVVNGSHMTYTFLCKSCIGADKNAGFTAQDTAGSVGMGWALASKAVSDPASPAAILPFHDSGFDDFTALLSQARSPLFGEWALLAGAAGAASNGSTTPIPVLPPGTTTGGGKAGDDSDDEGDDDEDDD